MLNFKMGAFGIFFRNYNQQQQQQQQQQLPSLKLTACTWKWMLGNICFPPPTSPLRAHLRYALMMAERSEPRAKSKTCSCLEDHPITRHLGFTWFVKGSRNTMKHHGYWLTTYPSVMRWSRSLGDLYTNHGYEPRIRPSWEPILQVSGTPSRSHHPGQPQPPDKDPPPLPVPPGFGTHLWGVKPTPLKITNLFPMT